MSKRKEKFRVGQNILVPAVVLAVNQDGVTLIVRVDNDEDTDTMSVWISSVRPICECRRKRGKP